MSFKQKLPGRIAAGLLILTTSLWVYWGVAEILYEGWGLPFLETLPYLAIGIIYLLFTLVALTWPRLGGWLLIGAGSLLTAFMISIAASRGWLSWRWFAGTFPVNSAIILIGILFLLHGRYRQQHAANWQPPPNWFRRNLRYILATGIPLLVALSAALIYAPLVINRVDDGDRNARLIIGNGVTLIWAPSGPGWNWKQPWGGYPSWDKLALYGVPPIGFADKPGYKTRHASEKDMQTTGLCRYLSADGTTLLAEPQNIWRMPTTDEVVRSLCRGGKNAGCTWDGESDTAVCAAQPNKETPLWAPDQPPIYYWTADEFDAESAWYVPYTGGIKGGAITHQPKDWGNPRHGYRCVREPN